MKPIKFKHFNTNFAEGQDEYNSLPALRLDSDQGEVITCWELSFKERLILLVTGKVWMNLISFNKPLTPSLLSINRKDMYSHKEDKVKLLDKARIWFKATVSMDAKLWRVKYSDGMNSGLITNGAARVQAQHKGNTIYIDYNVKL